MNAHTPGPWTYYQNTESSYVIIPAEATERLDREGVEIGEVFFGKGIKDPEANARLCAYSPELKAALVFAIAMLRADTQFLAERGFDTEDAEKAIDSFDTLIDNINGVNIAR